MKKTDRRSFLQAGLTADSLGLPRCRSSAAALRAARKLLREQAAGSTTAPKPALTTEKLTERVTRDHRRARQRDRADLQRWRRARRQRLGGAGRRVRKSLGGAKVRTLFNTHYHADQTGGNALFGKAGAEIHAHKITRQWLSRRTTTCRRTIVG